MKLHWRTPLPCILLPGALSSPGNAAMTATIRGFLELTATFQNPIYTEAHSHMDVLPARLSVRMIVVRCDP